MKISTTMETRQNAERKLGLGENVIHLEPVYTAEVILFRSYLYQRFEFDSVKLSRISFLFFSFFGQLTQ